MIKYITFDCYDTLVAYSAGKSAVIKAMVIEKGSDNTTADAVLARFIEIEYSMQAAAQFKTLELILTSSLEQALTEHNLPLDTNDTARIVEAVRTARPFDDVTEALTQLKPHYKLAILSNSQPDIIKHNIASIGVEFDAVVLAAEVKAYKPDLRMFDALIDRCACEKSHIVHVAQSFYHDIRPGHSAGLRTVWINRNSLEGDEACKPCDELSDLTGLATLLEKLPHTSPAC